MEKRTASSVIADLKRIISNREPLGRDKWLEAAFFLSLFREDEAQKLNQLNQEVSRLKLGIINTQEKRNVAAADIEVAATDKYKEMADQEARIYTIDELVRVAKKNSETSY